MILKALIIIEIAVAGVLGGWLLTFNSPTEPPQITPIVINETPVAIPTESTTTPTATQTIVIPIPTPTQQVESQVTEITTTETTPEPTPTPPPQTIYVPIYITQPALAPQPAPEPLPTIQPESTPSMSSIEIINPIPGKGAGRTYTAQPQIIDESNYVELGLVVRDDAGEPIKNVVVTITATDETQNKTLNNTGNVYPRYENEVRIMTPFYPFHYEFKTVGDHTITFTANGMTESVTLTVIAPDPA